MDKLAVTSVQQVLGGSLSRRAALVRLASGAVAATLAVAGRGTVRGTSPLAAPLDDQLAWVLATLNDGASSLMVAEVTERFDPESLAAVPPELVAGITQQIATAFAPVSLDGFTRPPTATQVNALLTSGKGTPLVVPVAVETAPPYRNTGLTYAPVPPPPGVPHAPTVGLDATPAAVPERIDGLFDIGGDRHYLSCLGADSPTVLLESGANDPVAPWFAIETAVAAVARVCSYDRAYTAGGARDPAAKPRTSRDMVADLHALIAEAGEAGPYVVVGHSVGALNARLYDSTYPDEVAGLVLIDPSHEEQNLQRQALLSPEHRAIYQQMNLDIEGIDLVASFAQVKDARASAPMQPMPLVVLTAGQGADPALLPPGWPVAEDEQLWHDLHADLAELVPNAQHVVADQSAHYIHQSQPDLIVESIRSVVDVVRDPDSWSTPTPGATPASGG